MIENVEISTDVDVLKLHYYFSNCSHSIDAKVRNECERELLSIANEIAKQLGLPIGIEVEAKKEGGLEEFYTFFIQNQETLFTCATLAVGGAITIVVNIVTNFLAKSKLDLQEQKLRIDGMKIENKNKLLDGESKMLQIEKVRNELEAVGIDTENITLEKIESLFYDNIKIKQHKSKFYSHLQSYKKVVKVETTTMNKKTQEIVDKVCVGREDFHKYIIAQNDHEEIVDADATIEIISPVLSKESYAWRGKYAKDKKVITFAMQDTSFRRSIVAEQVKFQNGSIINCELKTTRKCDGDGNVSSPSFVVNKVFNCSVGNKIIETNHGKVKRDKNSTPLFDSPVK